MAGFAPALRSIGQAQRFNVRSHSFQARLHLAQIAFQLLAQTCELRPVSIQSNAA
jgi:hypothetical protein